MHGARLLLEDSASAAQRILDLPAANWSAKKNGYNYRDKSGATACVKVIVRHNKIIAKCIGAELDLPAAHGPIGSLVAQLAVDDFAWILAATSGATTRSDTMRATRLRRLLALVSETHRRGEAVSRATLPLA